jgi:heat shock protein HtpX
MNMARTALLMAAMTAIFLAIGYALGGTGGMMAALLFAIATNGVAYWYSDKIVLSMYNAKEISATESPDLYEIITKLSADVGVPMPKIYLVPNPQPNAFATGRDPEHAAMAVTSGLMERLNKREITGVLAHEMAHIKNHDTLIMTVTSTIAGAIGMLANMAWLMGGANKKDNVIGPIALILLIILAPLAAMLVQLAVSRTREYEADASGAEITKDPMGLASALQNISNVAEKVDNLPAENNPATAHMFIINPLHMRSLDSLFSTHPKTQDRIAALSKMVVK